LGLAAASCAAMGLLVSAAGAPYLADFGNFKLQTMASNLAVSANSLQATLAAGFAAAARLAPVLADSVGMINLLTTGIIWIFALGSIAVLLIRFAALRSPNMSAFLASAVLAEVVAVCVGSSKFYPWYVGMFFPTALLLEEGHWIRQLALVLSVG
jgi:hypothetical protein